MTSRKNFPDALPVTYTTVLRLKQGSDGNKIRIFLYESFITGNDTRIILYEPVIKVTPW
jgi:hypothetical protein